MGGAQANMGEERRKDGKEPRLICVGDWGGFGGRARRVRRGWCDGVAARGSEHRAWKWFILDLTLVSRVVCDRLKGRSPEPSDGVGAAEQDPLAVHWTFGTENMLKLQAELPSLGALATMFACQRTVPAPHPSRDSLHNFFM